MRGGLTPAALWLLLLAVALLPFHLLAPRVGEIVLALAVLASLPTAIRDWRGWLRRRGFDGPALALVALGLAALAVHPGPGESVRAFRLLIVEPVVVYVLVTRLRPGGERIAYAIIAGAVAAGLVGLAQLVTGIGAIEVEGVQRIRGPYPSPNNLGLLLDRAAPLAVALALAGRRWLMAAAGLLVVAVALTYSVGAWLATGLGLAFVLWRMDRKRVLLGLAGLAILGAVVVLQLRPERVFSPTTTSLRVLLWGSSIQMLGDHPLLGVGLDNFLYLYPEYMHPDGWREPSLSHPHNLVMDWWLSLGVPGVAVLGWTLVLLVGRARARGALAIGLVGGFVAGLAHGQIDNSYFLPDLAALWWLQLGMLAEENASDS